MARALEITLLLLCLCHAAPAPAAPGVSAPLYVALVRVADLAPYDLETRLVRAGAASLRAQGYPKATALSKPPLQRALDAAAADPVTPGGGWAVPEPTGPGGPTLGPLNSSSSSSSSSTSTSTSTNTRHSSTSNIDSGTNNIAAEYISGQRRTLHQQVLLQEQQSFDGTFTAAPAGTLGLAVGPHHMLQASGPAVTITNLSSSGEIIPGSRRSVALSLLMAGAAIDCQGVFDPAAAYDHHAQRFLLSATCGGQGRVLLATSATSDANGNWFVFGLVADGANTSLACVSPTVESALADFTRVSYNIDGVFITYKSVCPSNTTNSGVGLLALPKYALYQGQINFEFPLFTSQDLKQALAQGAGSTPSCSQLEPVLPQGPADVPVGTAYFVCEVPVTAPMSSSPRKTVVVAALLDTAVLWQYVSLELQSKMPLMVACQATLAAPALPPSAAGLQLQQPEGATPLSYSPAPRGFWNGAAVLSGGKLYLASQTLVAADRSSPGYSRRPAIVWAELSISATTAGADDCPQSTAGRAARATWDWLTDHSIDWGSQLDANFTQHASSAATFAPQLDGSVHAADGQELSSSHTKVVRAALLWALGFEFDVEPCSCYRCYWGGQYYSYGGYNTGALGGLGYGYTSGGYYFAQGRMTRCQNTCTRCWYYGYPGNGAGNVGTDLANQIPNLPRVRSVNGQLTQVNGTTSIGSSINTLDGLDVASLLTPCTRSGALAVQVLRQGVLSQGGERPLGLTYPAIAVGPAGQLLVTYSYSGPGNVTRDTPAYLGVGATLIPSGATVGSSSVVQAGKGTVQPAPAASTSSSNVGRADWAELSAAAAHPGSGRVYAAVHYAATDSKLSSGVGTWISSWTL